MSNGLLLLARIDQGQLPFNPLAVDLSTLLEVIVEQVQPLAEARQITLMNDLPSGLWVQGDPDHLTSLFLNLLDNAVKYTPEAGVVRLWAQYQKNDEKNLVQVAVNNTGACILPEYLPHLFERFYRLESTSRGKGGAGLGLAIAQEITYLHGGTLTAHSDPHQGTTFTVTLPISRS